MIEASGVGLCTEAFGDPADAPILLVMGLGGSMLWWEEEFCRMLAEEGQFVIRYDHATPAARSPTSRGGRDTPPRIRSPTPPACSTPTAFPRRT